MGAGPALCLLATTLEGWGLEGELFAAVLMPTSAGLGHPLGKGAMHRLCFWFPIRKYLFGIGPYEGPVSNETAIALCSPRAVLARPLLLQAGALLGSFFIATPAVLGAAVRGCYVGEKVVPKGSDSELTYGFVSPGSGLVLLAGLRFVFLSAGVPEALLPQVQFHGNWLNPIYSLEVRRFAIAALEARVQEQVPSFSLIPGDIARRRYFQPGRTPKQDLERFRKTYGKLFLL